MKLRFHYRGTQLGVGNLKFLHRGTQLGVGNLKFCNIVGPNWELGIWEFIARNNIVGGHPGKQKHCLCVRATRGGSLLEAPELIDR